MKTLMNKITLLGILTILFYSCNKDGIIDQPVNPVTYQKVIISNNPSQLNQRLDRKNEVVKMIPEYFDDLKSNGDALKNHTKNFAFKLRANVSAPALDGKTLMATHVAIRNNFAVVTYNLRGEDFGGAVEVFDVSTPHQPQLVSQALFPGADINAVDFNADKIFIAGATSEFEIMEFSSPAFVARLSVNSMMQIQMLDTLVDVSSFSANGIKVSSEKIYVTSGDNGGLTIFDHELVRISEKIIFDARSVSSNSQNLFVLSGQPGKVNVFNDFTGDYSSTFLTGGANTPHSKSEISVNEKYIFTALNEEGVKIFNLNGTQKQHIPKPATPEGAEEQNHVTNSAAINYQLLFMANGESGISVAELIPELNDQAVMLGQMVFQDMNSSNFVQSKDSVVFVATGLGGLKILTISIDQGVPEDIIPTEPCPTLMNAIKAFLPETKNAMVHSPKLFAAENTLNIVTTEETPVYVTFIHEGAGWKNTFGYYAYPANDPPTSIQELEKYVVFPNVSFVNEGGGLEAGDMVQLGTGSFPANTVIGFYLVAQGWANGQMVKGTYTHYTNREFNPSNYQQHVLFIENGCEDLVLAFEDIRITSGDKDFNDIILVVKDNPYQFPNTNFITEGVVQINVVK